MELDDTQDDLPVAQPIEPKVRPYVKPPKSTPYEEPAETLGFIKNLPKSVLNMTKEVFVDFPKSVWDAGVHYQQNPMDWDKDMKLFLQKPGDTGDLLRRSVTDYYQHNLWKNFNDDPARALTDAAALMDGIGMLGKIAPASTAGKLATNVGKAATYVDPMRVAGLGAEQLFKKGLSAIGYGEMTPKISELYNHIVARESLVDNEFTAAEHAIPITDEQNEHLSRLLNLGEVNEIDDAIRQGGPVAQRYQMRRERVNTFEEPYIKERKQHFGYGSDDDLKEHFLDTKAKAVEHWSNEHMDMPIPKDQAKQMILDGTLDPVYNTMFREHHGNGVDIWDVFNKDRDPNKTLGRAEQRIANGEYLTDMNEISARQNRAFHNVKAKLDFLSGVKELLTQEGKILVGSGPEAAEKAKLLGYRELPEAFYKWYYENYNKGTSVLVNEMKKGLAEGLPQEALLAKLRESWNQALATGDMEKYAAGGKVYVPAHVAAWIGQELAPVSKFSQMYSQWQSRYKSLATVFNPRYWAPVLFGNALAATIYGLSPDMLKLGLKFRGDLPPNYRQLVQNEIWLKDLGMFDRKAKTLGQAASMLDNIYRQGMFANEVAKSSYARMRLGITSFFQSEDEIAQMIKHFGAAPEAHAAALTGLSDLKDSIATNIIKNDKEFSRLKRLEGRMTGEMAHLMALKQSNWSELSIGLDARKDRIAKMAVTLGEGTPQHGAFANAFLKQLDQLRLNAKARPELVDTAAVLQSVDNAISVVEKGRPDLLRYVVKQMKKAVDGTSPLMQRRSRLSVLADMVGKTEDRIETLVADSIQKLSESGKLDKMLPLLAKDRAVASHAAAVGNRFYGSMDDLLPFERKIIKQIVPFYTFTKAMTQLAFRFPFLYPKRTFIFSHLARAWNDIMDDDEAFMPSWTKNYVPVAFHQDGSVTMMRIGSLSPFSNVKLNAVGGEEVMPNVYDVLAQNPFLRVMMDMKGGTPDWSARPLSTSDKAVRLDNGEVIQWTGKGFQRVIAQPSMWKTVAGLFPQSQLIDQLLHGYAQTDRGWLFSPEPYKSPNGDVRYPKELVDRMLSLGIPSTTVAPEDLERGERIKVYRVVKEFQREMRTASPERRESLIESLRSYSQQSKRAINRD